eukprot:29131_1
MRLKSMRNFVTTGLIGATNLKSSSILQREWVIGNISLSPRLRHLWNVAKSLEDTRLWQESSRLGMGLSTFVTCVVYPAQTPRMKASEIICPKLNPRFCQKLLIRLKKGDLLTAV